MRHPFMPLALLALALVAGCHDKPPKPSVPASSTAEILFHLTHHFEIKVHL